MKKQRGFNQHWLSKVTCVLVTVWLREAVIRFTFRYFFLTITCVFHTLSEAFVLFRSFPFLRCLNKFNQSVFGREGHVNSSFPLFCLLHIQNLLLISSDIYSIFLVDNTDIKDVKALKVNIILLCVFYDGKEVLIYVVYLEKYKSVNQQFGSLCL